MNDTMTQKVEDLDEDELEVSEEMGPGLSASFRKTKLGFLELMMSKLTV